MQFQNLQVQWERLPKTADAELKPIEKDYLKVLYINWSLLWVLILAADIILVLIIDDIDKMLWFFITLSVLILSILANFIIGTASFKRKAFAVREKDILYRSGWIIQKTQVVPFSRVQHCAVQSGPFGRKYGLANVSIYTAASNGQDISIHGLKKDDAETIKNFILQQIQPLS